MQKNTEWLTKFLHRLSHDLIAPARNVQGFSELVLSKAESSDAAEDIKKCARMAAQESGKLYKMVEASLQLGRIYGAHAESKQLSLQKLVEELWEHSFLPVFPNATLTTDIPEETAFTMAHAHAHMLFTHVFENACLYCKAVPHITLSAETHDSHVTVTISDNGNGIAPADFEQACELFFRFNSREHSTHIGAGLAICQAILARYDGSMKCLDASGGTCLQLKLAL